MDIPSSQDLCTQLYDNYDNTDIEITQSYPKKETQFPNPWGQLVLKQNNDDMVISSTFDLIIKSHDVANHKYNVYRIGRAKKCDIRFNTSILVSNTHCMIYCKLNHSNLPNEIKLLNDDINNNNILNKFYNYFDVFIEDLSSNGTYVNNTMLKKNTPRQLHHGDKISLVDPTNKIKSISLNEIENNSFFIMIHLKSSEMNVTSNNNNLSMRSFKNLKKSSTVMKLLNQERIIEDYYELKHQLGVGSAGKVYECVNKETGTKWAAKLIDIRKVNNKQALDKIISEATLLRSLRHPYIIHLEDIFSDDKYLYLVMELSRGGDLFDRLVQKKKYTENETKQVIHKILQALVYLHDNNVAHRDIKPENILLERLDSDVDIKLSDFGLAKAVDKKNVLKSFCGTPQYLSPEVLQRKFTIAGVGTYSFEADMWSIGVLIYVLLSGCYPFKDETLYSEIENASYNYNNTIWFSISSEAKDLINRLIVVDPTNRLTAKQSLNHVWFNTITSKEDSICNNDMTISFESPSKRYHTRSSTYMNISTSSYIDSKSNKRVGSILDMTTTYKKRKN